jgi:hypothetical protein
MPDAQVKLVKTVNFGKGLSDRVGNVFYSIYDSLGSADTFRSSTGVYQLGTGTGVYGAQLTLNQSFSGSILWEVTASNGNIVFANEEVETDQKVTRHFTNGRWLIDENTHEMIFYQEDNTTEMARFDLKDKDGSATFQDVFERIRK